MKKIVLAVLVGLVVTGCTTKKEPEEKVIVCELNREEMFGQEFFQMIDEEEGSTEQEFNVGGDSLYSEPKVELKETYTLIDEEVVGYVTVSTTSGWTEDSVISQDEYVEMVNALAGYPQEGITTTVTVDDDKVIVTTEAIYSDIDEALLQYFPKVEADIFKYEDFGYSCQ